MSNPKCIIVCIWIDSLTNRCQGDHEGGFRIGAMNGESVACRCTSNRSQLRYITRWMDAIILSDMSYLVPIACSQSGHQSENRFHRNVQILVVPLQIISSDLPHPLHSDKAHPDTRQVTDGQVYSLQCASAQAVMWGVLYMLSFFESACSFPPE